MSVLLRTRSARRLSSMIFAAVRTHFLKKNTRVYRNRVTGVTRVTSNRVEVHRLNSQQSWQS